MYNAEQLHKKNSSNLKKEKKILFKYATYSLRPFLVVHFRNGTQIKATMISTVKLQFYPYDNFSLQNYNHFFEFK